MRRLFAALTIASLALLGATSARSQPRAFLGNVYVGMKGWGTVKLPKGVQRHPAATCNRATCFANSFVLTGRRVVLTEKPYKGWKFGGWSGACRSRKTKPKCVIDTSRIHKNVFGSKVIHVGVRFIPVAPGLTRAKPVSIGTAAPIGQGLTVKVNSANANVQLSSTPPAGAEYFDANLTVTYTGGGSQDPSYFGFDAVGSHKAPYDNVDGQRCSYPGPQPELDTSALFSGQSTTGYVCWTIAANDASSLELYFGGGQPADGTTWFALH